MRQVTLNLPGGSLLVDNGGRVWSLPDHHVGRRLKPYLMGRYLGVSVYQGSRCKKYYIHRLVALAFLPNPESKRCVNHKDGNKLNNKVDNLEWATHSENSKHAYHSGLTSLKRKYGVEHHNAKLTPEKVREIREKYIPRIYTQRKLASEYGVAPYTIELILKNVTWVGV